MIYYGCKLNCDPLNSRQTDKTVPPPNADPDADRPFVQLRRGGRRTDVGRERPPAAGPPWHPVAAPPPGPAFHVQERELRAGLRMQEPETVHGRNCTDRCGIHVGHRRSDHSHRLRHLPLL